ncbi:MAG: hypothetical protein R2873_08790 [Caldilineaceae bacterium]
MTGYAADEIRQVDSLGIEGILTKPVGVAQLLSAVAGALHQLYSNPVQP